MFVSQLHSTRDQQAVSIFCNFQFAQLIVPYLKKLFKCPRFLYNRGNGGVFMEQWRKDARKEVIMVDLEALVPEDHLLRKIEKVMDYEWLYERLNPYYCHDNGRPGTDPVVLIKMVLIQHLFGIPSLRQTWQRIQDTLSYRWFLGYGLLEEIPHFAWIDIEAECGQKNTCYATLTFPAIDYNAAESITLSCGDTSYNLK